MDMVGMRISPVPDGNRILVPQTVAIIFTDLPRIILNADIYCSAGYGVGALEPFGSRGRILLEAWIYLCYCFPVFFCFAQAQKHTSVCINSACSPLASI